MIANSSDTLNGIQLHIIYDLLSLFPQAIICIYSFFSYTLFARASKYKLIFPSPFYRWYF